MATINYADKVAINVNPNIPEINKVTDGNMNLIKQVGNQILTTMGVYTDDWNSSTTYAIGDIVIYDNRIFRNLTGTNTETTPDLDTTNWEETTIAAMAGGADIPIRPTAPSNPQDDDLWIDTSDNAMSGANVLNDYSTSNQDTYSCEYVNGTLSEVVKSGSNSNGYYTKYADGTLICRYFVGPITTNAGAGTTTPVTFPYEFIDTNWQTQLTMTNGQAYWSYVFANVGDKTKTGFNLKTWNNGGGTNSGQYYDYVAIGHWK